MDVSWKKIKKHDGTIWTTQSISSKRLITTVSLIVSTILSRTRVRIHEHCPGIANDLILFLRSNDNAFSWRLIRLIEQFSRKVPQLEINLVDAVLSLDKVCGMSMKSLKQPAGRPTLQEACPEKYTSDKHNGPNSLQTCQTTSKHGACSTISGVGRLETSYAIDAFAKMGMQCETLERYSWRQI